MNETPGRLPTDRPLRSTDVYESVAEENASMEPEDCDVSTGEDA